MYQKKLKPFVIPLIYGVIMISLITSLFFLSKALDQPVFDEKEEEFSFVINILDNEMAVVGDDKPIIRPYTDEQVKIIKYFYDYQAEAKRQEQSLVYHENTYMQNSGIDYGGVEGFEVVAILDGEVINVNEDNLLGQIVELRHNNDLISIYQSLAEVTVKKGDNINQGQIIGKSGASNIAADLKDHLHFEILYKGKVVDPETFYDKTIKDL